MRFYIIIFVAIGILGCTPKPVVETDPMRGWDMLKMRALWNLCFHAHRQNFAHVHPEYVGRQCDCVVDVTTSKYIGTELDKQPQNSLKDFFTKANAECFKGFQPKPNMKLM